MTPENPFASSFDRALPDYVAATDSLVPGPMFQFIFAWLSIAGSGALFGLIAGPIGFVVGGLIAATVGLGVTSATFGVVAAVVGRRRLYDHQVLVSATSGLFTGAISAGVVFRADGAGLFVLAAAGIGALGGAIPALLQFVTQDRDHRGVAREDAQRW